MEYKVNYTVVGLFVIALMVAAVFAGLWLSSSDHRHDYRDYLVYMDESVYGLSEQAPVKYNGVTIGYVKSIDLNPNNLKQVMLLLKIEDDIPITKSTVASLKAQGVTGITYLGLESSRAKSALLTAKPGEPYPVIASEPSLLVQLGDTIRDVSGNISALSQDMQRVLDPENQRAVKATLQHLETFTATLANNSQQLEKALQHAETLLQHAAAVSERLDQAMPELNKTFKEVATLSHNLSEASLDVKAMAKQGQTVMHVFSEQTLPETIRLMQRLDTISGHVEKVTATIQDNPSILIRGQVSATRGPGE